MVTSKGYRKLVNNIVFNPRQVFYITNLVSVPDLKLQLESSICVEAEIEVQVRKGIQAAAKVGLVEEVSKAKRYTIARAMLSLLKQSREGQQARLFYSNPKATIEFILSDAGKSYVSVYFAFPTDWSNVIIVFKCQSFLKYYHMDDATRKWVQRWCWSFGPTTV